MNTSPQTANTQEQSARANEQPPAAPGSKEANAPGADNARGTRHVDPEGRIVPVTIGSFLDSKSNKPTVHGMVLSHARKDKARVTGITLVKKKQFVEAEIERVDALVAAKQIDPATGKPFVAISKTEAAKRFDKYRIATYQAWTQQVAQDMLAGKIYSDGGKFNKDGAATALTLVRASKADADKDAAALERLAVSKGVPADELEAFLAKYAKDHPAKDAAIEAVTSEVAEQAPNAGQPVEAR